MLPFFYSLPHKTDFPNMALHLELLHSTLDAAINARRTLEILDVSSAIGGVTQSNCALAKNIDKHITNGSAHCLLGALFLVSDAEAVEVVADQLRISDLPQRHADVAVHAVYTAKMRNAYTRAEGIRWLAEALCDIPSVDLLQAFNKDQLIALRDLIGFASVSGITDDPKASVSSVADSLKALRYQEGEHDHD